MTVETMKVLNGDGTAWYIGGKGLGTVDNPFSTSKYPDTTHGLEVAKGSITGMSQADKFGRLAGIGTGDPPVDLYDNALVIGDYPGFPTGSAETMEILSTSAEDAAAGTGARTVTIGNLQDGSGNAMPDVVVTMTGVTPVSLGAQTYRRSTRVKVTTVGSTGSNVGTLTLRHTTTTANIFGVALPTKNGTRSMCYSVPLGKTLYVNRGNIKMARASGAAGSANVTILVRLNVADAAFVPIRDIEITDSDGYSFNSAGFFIFPAMSDFKVRVNSVSDAATIIVSEFDGYLQDD